MMPRVARSWMNKEKKLQKELRDVEKFSCVPKEFQESHESNLQQQQVQEVEQRRHDPMPEHQKVQKRSRKYTKHPGQKKKFAERQHRSRRGDAEASRRAFCKRGACPFLIEQNR